MRATYRLIPALLLATMCLSSCALLPEEETPKAAPLIRTYERETFNTAFVQREDLIVTQKIAVTYVPVQRETLSFALGGEIIDEVLVQVGDSVKKGDVLARLRLDDLEERIGSAQTQLRETQLRIRQLDALEELALRRCALENASESAAQRQKAAEAVKEDYAARRQGLEDARDLGEIALKALEEDLAERQILAPFDGTVTYALKPKEGEMSVFGHTVVTVADSTLSLFRGETELWDRFRPGDGVEIAVKQSTYPATVVDEEALGIAAAEKIAGKKAYVYFQLDEPTFELERDDRGTVTLVLDERLDVLTVPQSAVSTAGGRSIVYYQREDGMKAYKQVEVGVTFNRRTEIISGLSEGESVIVD